MELDASRGDAFALASINRGRKDALAFRAKEISKGNPETDERPAKTKNNKQANLRNRVEGNIAEGILGVTRQNMVSGKQDQSAHDGEH